MIDRRAFLISTLGTLGTFGTRGTLRAQSVAAAPADAWPQFRGTPSLTGVSSSKVPATLKRVWSWEGGEAIESSPAIVGDTVFVGTATGEVVAIGLSDGKLRWRLKGAETIGESCRSARAFPFA